MGIWPRRMHQGIEADWPDLGDRVLASYISGNTGFGDLPSSVSMEVDVGYAKVIDWLRCVEWLLRYWRKTKGCLGQLESEVKLGCENITYS